MVSVVMPVFNAEAHLDETLRSLETQTNQCFEVICVNDGSTDGSRAIIEKHIEGGLPAHIIDQPNQGPSAARNAGIAAATAKHFHTITCPMYCPIQRTLDSTNMMVKLCQASPNR